MDLKKMYVNMSRGTKIVTELLKTKNIGEHFTDENLIRLLSYHDNVQKDTKNIDYLVVKLNIYKQRELHFKSFNNPEVSVSYKWCLRILFGNKINSNDEHRVNVLNAFRNAIISGKWKQFYEKKNTSCDLCYSTSFLQIDHCDKPFQQIVDEFMANLNYADIVLAKDVNNWHYKLDCDILKQNWIRFHDLHATFRFLCKSCNSSIGSSGYKRQIV